MSVSDLEMAKLYEIGEATITTGAYVHYMNEAKNYGAQTALEAPAGLALQEMAIILQGYSDDDYSGAAIMPPPSW